MFKFLIITFVIIYVIARFAGYFFRFAFWLMGKKVEKEIKNQQKKNNYESRNVSDINEGDLRIIQSSSINRGKNYSGGEYIDFEEIK